MSTGLTSWWPCDAAEHERERNVVLGHKFGAAGPHTIRVLKDLAQEQTPTAERTKEFRVLTGYYSLAGKTFVGDAAKQRKIVEFAVQIGALDDFQAIDEDGVERFECRISGMAADYRRGKEAIRKADQRAKKAEEEAPEPVPSERDMSQPSGTVSPSLSRQDRTATEQKPPQTPPAGGERAGSELEQTVDEVLELLGQCERFTIDPVATRMAVENALATVPDADPIAAARTAVVWASDPAWRKTNAAGVFLDALRKTPPLTVIKGGQRSEEERHADALRQLGEDVTA